MTTINYEHSQNSVEVMEDMVTTIEAFNDVLRRDFLQATASTKRSSFSGRIRRAESEGVHVFDIAATDHFAQWTGEDIRATESADYFKLAVVVSNSCTIMQDGREAVLQAGDLCIYDTTRPYTVVNAQDARVAILMFPRSVLPLPSTSVRNITAIRLEGSSGFRPVVSALMRSLVENLEQFAAPSGHRLAYNVVDIVSTMLIESMQGENSAGGSSELMPRFCDYIEEHLADPALSLSAVAGAHYVSTRHVQAQFQRKNTTITAWIRERRLEMCRRDLSDPMLTHDSVSEIAARWGFVEPSYFSRVFKAKYGCSPTAFRGEYSAAA